MLKPNHLKEAAKAKPSVLVNTIKGNGNTIKNDQSCQIIVNFYNVQSPNQLATSVEDISSAKQVAPAHHFPELEPIPLKIE